MLPEKFSINQTVLKASIYIYIYKVNRRWLKESSINAWNGIREKMITILRATRSNSALIARCELTRAPVRGSSFTRDLAEMLRYSRFPLPLLSSVSHRVKSYRAAYHPFSLDYSRGGIVNRETSLTSGGQRNGETIDSVVKRGDHRSVAAIIIGAETRVKSSIYAR